MQYIVAPLLLLRNINHFELQSGIRLSQQEIMVLWCVYFMRKHNLTCGHHTLRTFYKELTGMRIMSGYLSKIINKHVRLGLASKKVYRMKFTHSPYYITQAGKELLDTFESQMVQMDEKAILECATKQFDR